MTKLDLTFFHTITPDLLQTRAVAAVVIKFNWTYVIVIHSDDDYGKGGIAALRNKLANLSSQLLCLGSVIPISNSATIIL